MHKNIQNKDRCIIRCLQNQTFSKKVIFFLQKVCNLKIADCPNASRFPRIRYIYFNIMKLFSLCIYFVQDFISINNNGIDTFTSTFVSLINLHIVFCSELYGVSYSIIPMPVDCRDNPKFSIWSIIKYTGISVPVYLCGVTLS